MMTLSAGTRLGSYEILAPLGAGGMGEVYRARDSKLGRDVAIKVLPGRVASDPDALARFEREARAVASLSHPNIMAIFDFGTQDGIAYAVTELLEGETLAARLVKGALPTEQLVRVGVEICAALTAAHRKGIVHRDLKPSNVMLTKSGVKLLDFGLAKAVARDQALDSLTAAPTAARDLTLEGAIVGTLSYMSPEQLEGKPVDARTDIFALGATLYEMATGKKAFERSSNASVISAILADEPPPVSAVRPMSPPGLDRLVRICLAKDPDARWQTAHDVGLQLQAISDERLPSSAGAGSARGRPGARWLPWGIAALFAGLAALAFVRSGASRVAPSRPVWFALPPPSGRAFVSTYETTDVAISPDGSRIAYVTSSYASSPARRGISAPDPQEGPGIWIRDISALEGQPVPGTDNASSLFWSPDGRSLGFFTPGKLKRIDLSGGAAVPICDVVAGGGKSGTWGASGDILFASIQGAKLYRVAAAGGAPTGVMDPDSSRGETRLNWPWFLPDGKRFLYIARLVGGGGNLMFAEPGKAPRAIAPMSSAVQYSEPGYVVYSREGALLGQRFDAKRGRLEGDPFSIAERVAYFLSSGQASFAASLSGTLAFQSHQDVSRLSWIDRAGRPLETIGPPGDYLSVAVAADGHRIFYDRKRPGTGTFDVWSFDLERGVETPVTTDPETEFSPVELKDGKNIVFSSSSNRGGAPQLVRRNLETGREDHFQEVIRAFQQAQDVSPDGRTLVYVERGASGNFDIWTLPLPGPGRATAFLQSPFDKKDVRFSLDGRFLAFISNESGQAEAYVMPYPGPGERVRLSSGGARLLQWGRDGKELFYLSSDKRLMSLPIRTSPSLETGTPVEVFKLEGQSWLNFQLSTNGQRFLAVVPQTTAAEQPWTVVVNWTASVGR
jgi:serine/threonine protein kinase